MQFSIPNPITLALIIIFLIPIISGVSGMLTRERVRYSMYSLLENLEFAGGIIIAVYITRRVFFEKDGSFFNNIYGMIPENIRSILDGRDMLTYLISVPIVLFVVFIVLRLVTIPLFRYVVHPFSETLHNAISKRGSFTRRFLGGMWMIPKAIVFTLVLSFVLNFSMYFIYSPALNDWTEQSKAYQAIYRNIMLPVLNSNVAKQIPVLVSKEAFAIKYFNGVTIDKALESNSEIEATARKIAGKTTDDRKKAYLLYKWICRNMEYDYSKAERVMTRRGDVESGSIPAFETRRGICFDFSCLYISMCRAVGLKVRLVTGSGYNGSSWGDHAWNQVFYPAENRWLNVDTTFGSTGVNYFDKRDFEEDHANSKVQGEW